MVGRSYHLGPVFSRSLHISVFTCYYEEKADSLQRKLQKVRSPRNRAKRSRDRQGAVSDSFTVACGIGRSLTVAALIKSVGNTQHATHFPHGGFKNCRSRRKAALISRFRK